MISEGLQAILSDLDNCYSKLLLDDLDPSALRTQALKEARHHIDEISTYITSNRFLPILSIPEIQLSRYFELKVVVLMSASGDAQKIVFNELKQNFYLLLKMDDSRYLFAAGRLLECLLVALQDFPAEISEEILGIVASITGREEGIRRPKDLAIAVRPDACTLVKLSSLLNLALASETFAFLKGLREPNLQLPDGPLPVQVPVFSLVSRKGGVGKSTIALSLALAINKLRPNAKVCVLDLDLTGPVWKYFLKPTESAGHTISYLNDLFDIEQPEDDFYFGKPDHQLILDTVAPMRIPDIEMEIGLLSFADWPRTNRFLLQAIANNTASFGEFLDTVIEALGSEYDAIIMDNSPGLTPPSLLTLAVVGRIQKGVPVVVSTPMIPDLRGTLLELSDLCLLPAHRAPMWVINQASSETLAFLKSPQTIPELAALEPGHKDMLPNTPVLNKAMRPQSLTTGAYVIEFDAKLRKNGLMEASLGDKLTINDFMLGDFFQNFISVIIGTESMSKIMS